MTQPAQSTSRAANPWLSQFARIVSVEPEIEAVATYHLRLIDGRAQDQFRFQPGQFNMLYVPGCGESAISMSGNRSRTTESLVHTIRVVGRVTEAIAKLRVGDSLGLRGPFGTCWPMDQCLGQDIVIVAGGIGLAPLRPAVYQFLANRHDHGRLILLYGARTADALLYANEFTQWQQGGLEMRVTVDRSDATWKGIVGVVPLLVDRLDRLRPERTILLTCGPEVMMDYSIRSALQRGLAKDRIWLSMERNMQCAVGLCGHCQLGPMFVCRDGPVHRFDRIEPFLRVRDL